MKYFLALLSIVFVLSLSVTPIHAKTPNITFSPEAHQAINTLAKDILTNGLNSQITDIKAQLDPQDYATVKTIGMLPDSPFYFLKDWGRSLQIFFTFDRVGKVHQQLKRENQKTLETLLLLEKAIKENHPKKHERLIGLANTNLESVGSDFDQIRQTIVQLKKDKSPDLTTIQDEAFRFAGQYLKHQVLLQQQEDQLTNTDFLLIESTRVKHLGSLANIVVAGNRDPEVFSEELAKTLSSQVGSNYSRLSLMAILRDLENNASEADHQPLETAQSILRKEFEAKLSKLSKKERLQLVERYSSFIHGSPIRQFQAYNLISKSFTSEKMKVLTAGFKDKAAQNFKAHLTALNTEESQRQFVQILFGNDPIDVRLLAYTEIQLQKPKVLGVTTQLAQANPTVPTPSSETISVELQHLQALKTILSNQFCQTYGQNPESLENTRFFTRASTRPDVLDIRVAQFVGQAMEACGSKTPKAGEITTALTAQIEQRYIDQAKQTRVTKLPARAKAKEILQEEKIETNPQDEQKIAQQVAEEITQIEEKVSNNPTIAEEEEEVTLIEKTTDAATTESGQVTETVTDAITDEQTIIEEIIQSDDPTEEEIVEKEEQIIEEIIDSAEDSETSPLIEELPEETQDEITKQITTEVSPSPTESPTPEPVVSEPTPTTIIEEVIETGETTTETTTETITEPTPKPDLSAPAL